MTPGGDRAPSAGRLRATHALDQLPTAALERLQEILGDGLLLAEDDRRERSSDWWPITKVWGAAGEIAAMPAAVAIPDRATLVRDVLETCAAHGVPVTTSGGRSGVCGQAIPVGGGLVLDTTRLDRVVEIDRESLAVTVEAGLFGPALELALKSEGLTLGHFPQSIALSTVGGWLACRSAGQYSTRYGKIEEMVLGFDAALATPKGASGWARFKPEPAGALGPDIGRLFLGSEGTLGVITQATLRVRPLPVAETRAAFRFARFEEGAEAARRVVQRGCRPACLRLYDPVESARLFPHGAGSMLIAIAEGDEDEIVWEMGVISHECSAATPLGEEPALHWMEHRNDVSALDAAIARGLVVDTIELAGLWRDIPQIYRRVIDSVMAVEGSVMASAHLSHLYLSGGCLYFTLAGAPDPAGRDQWYADVWEAVMRAGQECGAALSHHHGVGIVRARYLREELGEAGWSVFQAVKDTLDPEGILNPLKMGLADRLGLGSLPWPPGIV